MLYANRERDRRRRESEAAGDDVWASNFPQNVRVKLWLAFEDAVENERRAQAAELARHVLLREEGIHSLANERVPYQDLHGYLLSTDTAGVASVVEALLLGLHAAQRGSFPSLFRPDDFVAKVNEILAFERLSFELVNRVMVPLQSRELHVDVVLPTLSLLGGRPQFRSAEDAYQDALREIAHGDAADSITDSGRALQEALVAVGCKGNALGPLLTDARKRNVFGTHDYPLTEAVAKAVDWVSADRSNMGDAHKAGAGTRDDAWLTVHVVGALILRLAGPPRVVV